MCYIFYILLTLFISRQIMHVLSLMSSCDWAQIFWLFSDFRLFFLTLSDFVRLCPTLSDFVWLCPTLSESVRNGSQIDVGDYFTPKWTVTGLLWPRSCSRQSFWNALIRGVFTEAVYNWVSRGHCPIIETIQVQLSYNWNNSSYNSRKIRVDAGRPLPNTKTWNSLVLPRDNA